MSLQAYLYDYLNNCDSVRALVDNENGIRRMDRPSKGTFRTCVCIGRVINGTVPGAERRPFLYQSPAISIWVRPELEAMGDLTLQEIFIELMRRLVWVGDEGFPAQDCVGAEPPVLVYASEFVGDEIEPNFDEDYQAWTKRFRIRFLVGFATCLPVAEDCSPCIPIPAGDVEDDFGSGSGPGGDGGNDDEDDDDGGDGVGLIGGTPPEALLAGTGYSIVQPGQESGIDPHDLYITNPSINTTTFDAHKKPLSIAIPYTTVSFIGRFASAWFAGIRAFTVESDYWHIGGNDEAHRLVGEDNPTTTWHIRPSVSLANRMADYVLTNMNPYFEGVFVDNATGSIPEHTINEYREADEWVEANLPAVQAAWTAMQAQYLFRLKQSFGAGRCVLPNTGGTTWADADGIMIERGHVQNNGVPWAMARFQEQKEFWQDNEDRYVHPNPQIACVLNIELGPTLDPTFSIPGLVWPGTTTNNP